MLKGTFNKLIAIAIVVAFAAAVVLMFLSLKEASLQNDTLYRSKQRLELQIKNLSRENAYKAEYYFRLIHDDSFADRVIREKLGFSKLGELVFRFEDSKPVAITEGGKPISGNSDEQISESEERAAALNEEKKLIEEIAKLAKAQKAQDEPTEITQNGVGVERLPASVSPKKSGSLTFSNKAHTDFTRNEKSVPSSRISNDFVLPKKVPEVEAKIAIKHPQKKSSASPQKNTSMKKSAKKLSPEAERAVKISERFK